MNYPLKQTYKHGAPNLKGMSSVSRPPLYLGPPLPAKDFLQITGILVDLKYILLDANLVTSIGNWQERREVGYTIIFLTRRPYK